MKHDVFAAGGRSGSLDYYMQFAEALLVLSGCPDEEIPTRVRRTRNALTGR
jgi:hypothetical protein